MCKLTEAKAVVKKTTWCGLQSAREIHLSPSTVLHSLWSCQFIQWHHRAMHKLVFADILGKKVLHRNRHDQFYLKCTSNSLEESESLQVIYRTFQTLH